MKKTFIIILAFVALAGCNHKLDKRFNGEPFISNDTSTYEIMVIDSCQYIFRENNGYQQGPIFTHKGNCNNPIHKHDNN